LGFIRENPNDCSIAELLASEEWIAFQADDRDTSKEIINSLLGKSIVLAEK
jgi:hypothetical protein